MIKIVHKRALKFNNCVVRATLWFCLFLSFFFPSTPDFSLFLESGKGLTSAVFTENMDLRPDW